MMAHHLGFTLTLDYFEDIAPNTRHFIFLADKAVSFLPGQFITLHWTYEGHALHRNYSLANYGGYDPLQPTRLELAATYIKDGFASKELFAMQPGSQIKATVPFGRLTLRDELVKRYLMIATGTGITPYRTMLSSFVKRMQEDPELHILLFFGVRYSQDLLYRDELAHFAEKYPRFTLKVYYSREKYPTCNYENLGYVTNAFNDAFQIIPEGDMVYLCGNPKMVDDVYLLLCNKGLPSNRIRREKYVSPKKVYDS